jgi:hypothetical protein
MELMHIIRKGQFSNNGAANVPVADQFFALSGLV